jgi:hypothetical protein
VASREAQWHPFDMSRRHLAALGLVLLACGTSERSRGTYEAQADGGFVIEVLHTATPRLDCVSEQMRQTEIRVELSQRPTGGQTIDLATAHVRYVYGGQIAVFHGEDCRGTLHFDEHMATATIVVSCRDSHTAEQRSFGDTVELTRL